MVVRGDLQALLQDARLWRAGDVVSAAACTHVASGWATLDRVLGGGWPLGQLTELLVGVHGAGEFTLLLPALRALTAAARTHTTGADGWVCLVAPPHIPYAPALTRGGIELTQLLMVRPRSDIDAFWSMEQILQAGACAAVLGWSDLSAPAALRRLQLAAAAAAGTWTVLFRSGRLRPTRSPAPLRLQLTPEPEGQRLVVDVFRRRGGRPVVLRLDLAG